MKKKQFVTYKIALKLKELRYVKRNKLNRNLKKKY